MLARAAWLAASALLLTATPTLSVEGLEHVFDQPIAVHEDVPLPAQVPALPVAPALDVHAQVAPHLRADVTISILGASAPAADDAAVPSGTTKMVDPSRPVLNAPSQVAAVVAKQLRAERDAGIPFTLAGLDAALGDWRASERPDRLLVGRGELTVTDAAGKETRCGLTAAALYTVWGEHVRMAVRAVDANPACAPLSSSAPRGLLARDATGWVSDLHGARGQTQHVRTGEGERAVPLDYRVTLGDGTTFAFHGLLDALPVEPAGSA
ncbi:MAG: hypothetical protein LC624_11350 [Halobacteriales archaeon]|nr:hypothetical protein [Halobacteriales archaeon]